MNAQDRQIVNEFPYHLDKAVNDKFGAKTKCNSIFDIFGSMEMVTSFNGKGKKKKEIELYISGYMAGNVELRNRLQNQ